MDTNDDANAFDPPRPDIAPPSAPPVLPPPMSGGQPPSFESQAAHSGGFTPPTFTAVDGEPTATVVPTGSAGKRSKGKMAGGLIAVVALVGAGGFAVSKIVSGSDGGASSPAEVGTQLMDSLAAEDALGVVDLLLPGERDTYRQPLIDIVDNLKRLEIVGSGANLDKVGGVDISFEGVKVETTETNVDDISNIRISATSTASIDGKSVPIGDLLIDEAFGGDRPQLDAEPQQSDVDWNLTTVKRDGRWYLSAFYSIAENARGGGDDIPVTGLVARGAETPDGAVQAIFDAVDGLDLEQMIVALNPNEAEALQRYAPMFLDGAQSAVDDLGAKVAFADLKFTVNGSGDRRSVAIDGFSMTASANGEDVTVEDKDGCVIVTSKDTTFDTCKVAGTITDALGALGLEGNEDLTSLVTTIQAAFADMEPVGITVQKVGGQWYVSPVGTYLDLYLAVLTALDKGELTDIIDGFKKVADSFSTGDIFGIGSGTTVFGNDSSPVDNTDTTVDTTDGTVDTTVTDDTTFGTGDGTSGFDACFNESDYVGYSRCLLAGIADGTIDPSFVAPYYRFDECGAGALYWSGDVYSMTDADFTAFAATVAPCFKKYVDDGTISEFELPYELSRPDCLEGKNWYNVTDTDYTNRVFECVTA